MADIIDVNVGRLKIVERLNKGEYDDVEKLASDVIAGFPKDVDYRPYLDQALKEHLLSVIETSDNESLKRYIQYSIQAVQKELCSATIPAALLGDIFDVSTLDRCEQLFSILEENVSLWKENAFFSVCKNNVLRMCNDLLRRLSRSQNTIFCGRILLFLAKFFPFSERSGLNVVSEFNLENVTDFSTDGDIDSFDDDASVISSDAKDKNLKLDYTVYSKFWSLQDFFRCPNNCYIKPKWNIFCNYAETILSTFTHYKLDHMLNRNQNEVLSNVEDNSDHHYFAKFLTNHKLLVLQLGDTNVRYCVLIQFLVLFQYLNAPVKFKAEGYELKPEQVQWLSEAEKRVYKLIEETPPDGKQFAEVIRRVLEREQYWNNWKNEGCPELKKPCAYEENEMDTDASAREFLKPTRTVGDFIKDVAARKKFYLGNRQLSKLWNMCPNNLEACRASNRNFLPVLESYFDDVLMEANPESCIEPEYKKVNNRDFSWRGLRLLARKSPYFFAQSNAPIPKTSDYLEIIVKKFMKEKPLNSATSTNTGEVEQRNEINEPDTQEDFINDEAEVLAPPMDEAVDVKAETKQQIVTKEQLDQVAELITDNWQRVATQIGYQVDEIEFFITERPTDEQRARYLLQVWSEDSEDPSPSNLASILEELGMHDVVNALKSQENMEYS